MKYVKRNNVLTPKKETHKETHSALPRIAYLAGLIALVALATFLLAKPAVSEENPITPTIAQEKLGPQKPPTTQETPKIAPKPQILPKTTYTGAIPELIRKIGTELGMTDTQILRATAICKCESGFRPEAIGDSGRSHGLWQIFSPAHPTITYDQAHDPVWSTTWALNRMKQGSWSLWTCNRKV